MGGQTPICDMRHVTADMMSMKDVVGDLIDNGCRYYRTLPSIETQEGSVYNCVSPCVTFFCDNRDLWSRTVPDITTHITDGHKLKKGTTCDNPSGHAVFLI